MHLRIAHRSYPAHGWATGLDSTSDGGPGWRDYLEQSYQHVWAKDFWGKEIYLGVRLGQRGVRAQLSGGMLSQFAAAYGRGEGGLRLSIDNVVNSIADQFSLLCESLPGERIRLNSYLQRQPLCTIAGGCRPPPW